MGTFFVVVVVLYEASHIYKLHPSPGGEAGIKSQSSGTCAYSVNPDWLLGPPMKSYRVQTSRLPLHSLS